MISVHFYDFKPDDDEVYPLVSQGFPSIDAAIRAARYVVEQSRSFAIGIVRLDDKEVSIITQPSESPDGMGCSACWPTFDDMPAERITDAVGA